MTEGRPEARPLSQQETTLLTTLSEKPPSPRIQDRARAILMSSQGQRTTQILLAVSRKRETVLRWIKAFNRRGTASLACSAAPARS